MLDITLLTTIGCVGLGLMLLLVVFDGVFDIFGGEPVLPTVAFFGAMFGFSGALATMVMPGDSAALLIGPLAFALFASAVFFLAYRAFKRIGDQDESFVPNPNAMVGTTATVTWWMENNGEVMATFLGQPRRMKAYSEEELRATQTVYITEVTGASQVQVTATKPA